CFASNAPDLCYRSNCVRTARAFARELGISSTDYTVSFQSRLGIDQWLRPATDKVIDEMPQKGIERLVVFSPSFTADCLETLEELEMRGRESFIKMGGKEFYLVPSLNDGDDWAELLAEWIQQEKHLVRAEELRP